MKVGAINIICTDLQRSLHFYRDLLGFALVEQQDWFAHLTCGDRDFTLLAVAKEPNERHRYCQRPSISFDLSVSDLPGALAMLQNNAWRWHRGMTPMKSVIELIASTLGA